jgi:hypothetical protein
MSALAAEEQAVDEGFIDYVEGGAPGIPDLPRMPDLREAQLEQEQFQPSMYPGWSEDHFHTILRGFGSGMHLLLGQTDQDWLMTQEDLDRIAPPMTRIANRWEPALKASTYADPFLVAYGLTLYTWRSMLERARALRDAEPLPDPQAPRARYERSQEQPQDTGESGEEPDPFLAPGALFPQAAQPRMKQ